MPLKKGRITTAMLLQYMQNMQRALVAEIGKLDNRMGGLESRMVRFEVKLERVEANLSRQIDAIDKRLDAIEIGNLPKRAEKLEATVGIA